MWEVQGNAATPVTLLRSLQVSSHNAREQCQVQCATGWHGLTSQSARISEYPINNEKLTRKTKSTITQAMQPKQNAAGGA